MNRYFKVAFVSFECKPFTRDWFLQKLICASNKMLSKRDDAYNFNEYTHVLVSFDYRIIDVYKGDKGNTTTTTNSVTDGNDDGIFCYINLYYPSYKHVLLCNFEYDEDIMTPYQLQCLYGLHALRPSVNGDY